MEIITSQKSIDESAFDIISKIREIQKVKMQGEENMSLETDIIDIIRNSSKEVVNFSFQNYRKISSPLLTAISDNNVPIVEALLQQGADPNIGETLFTAACIITRHEDLIPTLVKYGADVNYRGKKFNRTVLHFVVDIKDIEAVVRAGGDVNAQDINGDTVLMTALKKRWYGDDPIKALLKHGANANAKKVNGETVLMTALKEMCSLEIIEELLKYGADIHAKDNYDNTVLHYTKNADIISLLVNRGADINAQNKVGQTPLMCECYDEIDKVNKILSLGNVRDLINPCEQSEYFVLALEKLAKYQEKDISVSNSDVLAAFYRDNKKIKKLVFLGADITIKNNMSINAMDLGLNLEVISQEKL